MFGKKEVYLQYDCKEGRHWLQERCDIKLIKTHQEQTETLVEKTYLFDICCMCGKIFYPEEEDEEKK